MTNIYIVKGDLVFWDYAVMGVYSSKEKANKAILSILKKYTQDELNEVENYNNLDNYGLVIEEYSVQ